jgi:hypothetical protein
MKDVLAQLRTSHFWLVMTAVGLLIVPSFPRSSVYRNAYDELTRLIAVNATLTSEDLTQTFNRMALPAGAKVDPATFVTSAPWHVAQLPCQYIKSQTPLFHFSQPASRPAVWMTMPREKAAYAVPFQLPPTFSTAPGDRTLAQLTQIWAFLDNDDHAFIITGLAPTASKSATTFALPGVVAPPKAPGQRIECVVGALTWSHAILDDTNPESGELIVEGDMETDVVNLNGRPGSGGGGSFQSQPIPVGVQSLDFPLFASHLSAYFAARDLAMTDLAGQQFPDAFADLTRVARGLESLTLHDLRAYVERMTEESGTDVEIFGARLPVDILVEWGIPVLVIMQLYFWLHLTRFFASGRPSREVASFPWIACYPQLLARAVTLCSVALAPIAAAALLYFGTTHRARSVWFWAGFVLATLVSTVLAARTAIALLRLSRAPTSVAAAD